MEFRHTLLCILTALCAFSCIKETNSAAVHIPLVEQITAQTINISENDNGNLNKEDLALFAQQLTGVRIIGLGEQTHGAGSIFKLKTQLIKYLHQNHNFDLLILESGMYDVQKIWQQAKLNKDIKSLAPDNIFYMYANSNEVTPLFKYVNEQINTKTPLTLVGFDSQHTGGYSNNSLVKDLTAAVAKSSNNLALDTQWEFFSENVQQVLNLSTTRLTSTEEKLFWKQLTKVQQTFKNDGEGFWYRITRGLEAQAKRQWKIMDNRSEEMGENIKWWAEQYPDKKIIVWAHTWHLTHEGNNQRNAGKVISETFGDAYYMVHFTGASGTYLDYIDLQNKSIKAPSKNSIENILYNHTATDISFVNTNNIVVENNNTEIFSNDYNQTIPLKNGDKYWDGFFFIKEIVLQNL